MYKAYMYSSIASLEVICLLHPLLFLLLLLLSLLRGCLPRGFLPPSLGFAAGQPGTLRFLRWLEDRLPQRV